MKLQIQPTPNPAQAITLAPDAALNAITEYERCRAIADVAWKAASEVSRAFEAAREKIGFVIYKGEEVYTLKRLEFLCEEPDPDYERARAELLQRLPAFQKEEKLFDVCRFEEKASRAERKATRAQIAMFKASPTTPTAAAALLRHAADYLEEMGINDTQLEEIFASAIRNAAVLLEHQRAA